MTKQLCRDCKHLETDGMFGIFCGVGGDNTKYDCPKYAKRSDRMTENKRFQIIHLGNPYDFVVKDHNTNKTYGTLQGDDKSLMELLNELCDEKTEQSKRWIVDDAGTLIDMQTRNTYDYVSEICPILNELDSENRQIKDTITEMYNNERTALGKSVLKQLLEAIQ